MVSGFPVAVSIIAKNEDRKIWVSRVCLILSFISPLLDPVFEMGKAQLYGEGAQSGMRGDTKTAAS
jgi:hypothetical protein